MPLLILRNQVLLPGETQSFQFRRRDSLAALAAADAAGTPLVAVFPQIDPAVDKPEASDLHAVGVLASVVGREPREGGEIAVSLEGVSRLRLEHFDSARATVVAARETCPEHGRQLRDAAALRERAAPLLGDRQLDTEDPGRCCDQVAAMVVHSAPQRAALLQQTDVSERLRATGELVAREFDHRAELAGVELRTGLELPQLWPLAPGAGARIERAVAAGTISGDEAQQICDFAANGYVVWRRLIAPEVIDALVADIRSIAQHPGHFLTTDHKNGWGFRFSGADFDSFESIFDTYVNFESARRVCFHPTLLRFLELIFDARPVAFQQLLFQRSNGHPLHQDTAYVCVQEPLFMAATWIALEDVVRGRGELTYYEGSHLIDHYLFHDGSKRYNAALDDEEKLGQHLREQCQQRSCAKRDFIAEKGDVFLWAADLVHGSNPRTRPEHETRMSCVTHYCPETTQPLWTWLHPDHRQRQPWGDRALLSSSHYRLPTGGGLARPTYRGPLPN